ncbi:hypothetical protein ACVWVY_008687 [Bradyrhizobium sp. URHC0002]
MHDIPVFPPSVGHVIFARSNCRGKRSGFDDQSRLGETTKQAATSMFTRLKKLRPQGSLLASSGFL